MHYVIIRDDDTNAFTPVECLERLYRPFLDKGLPVNLATIPAVSTQATMGNGQPEGFLVKKAQCAISVTDNPANGSSSSASLESEKARIRSGKGSVSRAVNLTEAAGVNSLVVETELPRSNATVPVSANQKLVSYLLANPGFHIVQHGCHHDYLEFDRPVRGEIARRLEEGRRLLQDAGFSNPRAFVAPYDKLSRVGLQEVAARYRVLSTGWYELRRLPYSWWLSYGFKKLRKAPHWRVGQTILLSHPGCLLSCHRMYSTMLGGIFHYLETQQLTVLVTHWWEYFRNQEPDERFIDFLHETASYLATHPQVRVISFDDLASGAVPLN